MVSRRTVITGVGALTGPGMDIGTTLAALRRAPAPSAVHPQTELWPSFPGHPVIGLRPEQFLSSGEAAHLAEYGLDRDKDFLLLLAALRMAAADAFVDASLPESTGLVLAQENPGVTHLIGELMGSFFETPPAGMPLRDYAASLFRKHGQAFFHVQSFPHLFHASRLLEIRGFSLFVNNACASGLYALEAAHQAIASGQAEVVLVGTADHGAEPTKHLWFEELGLYSHRGLTRPFDHGRDGFLLGDAGAAVVLESLEHAQRRNAQVYGEYRGGAFVQEAWQMTLPDVAARPYADCISRAMARAGVSPSEIDLIAAHGTGTPLGDRYEALCLRQAFGNTEQIPAVAAFKSFVGHTLGASALLETILALLCMKERFVPGVPITAPDPQIALPVLTEGAERRIRTVLKSVNAFAGFDAAVILQEVTQ